ncbi:hypothetical protein D9M68_342730 [compost metagenome]
MLKRIATFVDHPLTRVVALLIGMAAIAFLGLFGVVVALTPKTNWMLAVGAGGLVGLVGWWLRVFVSLPTLAAHPLLRWTVCGSLAIGITTITYTVLAWPDAYAWRQFLYPIGLTGLLLFVGTLASW